MPKVDIRKNDLNLLVVLDVLLDELHISNAAKRLNLSQPAMSRALARLRIMFDDPLIVRVSKGYQRTPRGEMLVSTISTILNNIENTLSERDFDPKVYKHEFAVCTLDYGEAVLMPRIMERIMAESPGIKIKIAHRRMYSIDEVLDGTADILLGTVPEEAPKHCVVQHLYDDRFVCVVHKDHPLASKGLSLEDYIRYPHSIIHTGESPNTTIDIELEKLGLKRNVVKRSPHFVASVMGIGDSNIIQTIPKRLAEKMTRYADLVMLDMPLEVGPVRVGQMWHVRDVKDPAHMWFRELIHTVATE